MNIFHFSYLKKRSSAKAGFLLVLCSLFSVKNLIFANPIKLTPEIMATQIVGEIDNPRSKLSKMISKTLADIRCKEFHDSKKIKLDPLEFTIFKIQGNPVKLLKQMLLKEDKNTPLLEDATLHLTTGIRSKDPLNNDIRGMGGTLLSVATNKFLENLLSQSVVDEVAKIISQSHEAFTKLLENSNNNPKELEKWLLKKCGSKSFTLLISLLHRIADSTVSSIQPDVISIDKNDMVGEFSKQHRKGAVRITLPLPEIVGFFLQPKWAKTLGIIKSLERLATSSAQHSISLIGVEMGILKSALLKHLESKHKIDTNPSAISSASIISYAPMLMDMAPVIINTVYNAFWTTITYNLMRRHVRTRIKALSKIILSSQENFRTAICENLEKNNSQKSFAKKMASIIKKMDKEIINRKSCTKKLGKFEGRI
ncbi:hypothetical protein ACFLY6_01940 [Candidatus Dependentiae bacterium]